MYSLERRRRENPDSAKREGGDAVGWPTKPRHCHAINRVDVLWRFSFAAVGFGGEMRKREGEERGCSLKKMVGEREESTTLLMKTSEWYWSGSYWRKGGLSVIFREGGEGYDLFRRMKKNLNRTNAKRGTRATKLGTSENKTTKRDRRSSEKLGRAEDMTLAIQ